MGEVIKHFLKPTALIPNSPQPLLHYRGIFRADNDLNPSDIHRRFDQNGWKSQWIFRYGPTQCSHYHSQIHECMVVLSGTATIRFGAADTSDDLAESTYGSATEPGGIEIRAQPGDVFVIPAGVAHKTYNTTPSAPLALLTPGEGRGIRASNLERALSEIKLTGYTMMGAYPKNCGTWDFSIGGEDVGRFEISWNVAKPDKDPIFGSEEKGICGQWKDVALSKKKNPHEKL